MDKRYQSTVIRTVCQLQDGQRCGLLVHVDNGVITKVKAADFPHLADRRVCAKGLASPQLVNHPERLRYPLKRTGERGENKWHRISWTEALDSIGTKLEEIGRRCGSTSIAWLANEGSGLKAGGYSRLVSLTKGTWVDWLSCGDAAGPCADVATFGSPLAEEHLSLIGDPKFSIVWGYNPAVSNHRRMHSIIEANKKGCRLVVIDPRFTASASRADEHISIRPGTDGALALAMIYVVLERGLQDKQFIANNTVGPFLVRTDTGCFLRANEVIRGGDPQTFVIRDENTGELKPHGTVDAVPALTGKYLVAGIECAPAYQLLADMVQEHTPERVSEITDVPADVIRRVALSYASQKPASIHRGWGLQRTFHGDLVCRAINTLAAITGNINLNTPSTFTLNARSFLMPDGAYNHIPALSLYAAIVEDEPAPIRAVWCASHNFVDQLPNPNKFVNDALPRLELVVVCDLFMTTSASYADYVLPVASFLECTDVDATSSQLTGRENCYLQLQQKVVEPVYECKSDFQIAAELGKRMGFTEYFNRTEEQYIEELISSVHSTHDDICLSRLKEGPILAPLEKRQRLDTPTGRIEFYVERLKQFGQELPIYKEPMESGRSEKGKTYPLSLLSTHPTHRIHSVMGNIPSFLELEPAPSLEINPADAKPRNINDGDVVRVFNDNGHMKLVASITQDVRPGVVNVTEGWSPGHYIEGHINQLAHGKLNPVQQYLMQPNVAFYDVLVEVVPTDRG